VGRLQGAPKIIQLLTDLADPDKNTLLREFYADPHEVMSRDEYNLTPREQAIVLGGDLELIQAALDSAAIAADFHAGSSMGIVVPYTPPPRPPPQTLVATFE
jgi:hypothetical protein